ncbi:glycosyltransferase [Carboxylicivirga linearis]|uniref:Glycosyltransferase n=1 Tax=Carboxylicivirga linearis TaxID=1628157 RepID=A0ABS5K0S4_9BACT|nr:glycosyltransferase [Carboxylicivirga linearis]MBS2100782.1 glycosyltransferase [Carboxylicivirga linearis]
MVELIVNVTFWILITSLLISYIGYPFAISLIKKKKRGLKCIIQDDIKVHLIITCYNEEAVIEDKIRNSFKIDFPRECYVYVIIDKSEDRTSEIAHQLTNEYPNLIILDKGYRSGKNDSINYFYEEIKPFDEDILFFTDANTFYEEDSFMKLFERIKEGAVVVGGSMKYIDQYTNSAKSEGLYWKYEEWIRRNESRFGRTIAMNGGNMAMVAKYFKKLPCYVPNDFYIPISLVSNNKTLFASNSVGIEKAIQDEKEELKRKNRMANRQMNAILLAWKNFSFVTKVQLLFHKIIRWLAIPIFLFATLCSLILDFISQSISMMTYYLLLMWLIIFISVLVTRVFKVSLPILSTINYAYWVHHYGAIGVLSAFRGIKISQWGKALSNR